MRLIITYVLYICTWRFLSVAAHSYYALVCSLLRDLIVPDPRLCVCVGSCMFVTAVLYREAPLGCSRLCNLSRNSDTCYKGKYALQNNVCVFVVGPRTRSFSRLRTANLTTPI